MKRFALVAALALAAAPALAQQSDAAGAKSAGDPMAGYTPPKKLTGAEEKALRKEVTAFFQKMEAAGKKGDLEAAAAMIDFPVMMITDSKAGEGLGGAWTEEQWKQQMAPFYEKPMEGMSTTHKPTITFVSKALAVVTDEWTMTMGKQKMSGRSGMVLVKRGADWKAKTMVEGGWGDSMGSGTGSAADAATGSTGETGSTGGSAGATTGAPGDMTGSSGSTGTTGAEPSGSTGSTGGTAGEEPASGTK